MNPIGNFVLKEIGTAKSIPALEKAAKDNEWFMRQVAEETLAAIKVRLALPKGK